MKVIVVTPWAGFDPPQEFTESYWNAKIYALSKIPGLIIQDHISKPFPIHSNRNACAGHICESPDFECDTTIWLDADMWIPHDTIYRMLTSPHKILSGIYFLKKYPHNPLVFQRWRYDEEDDMWIYQPEKNLLRNEPYQADMVGMGCVKVPPEVFRAVEPPHFKYRRPSLLETDDPEKKEAIAFMRKYYVETNTEESWFWHKVKDAGYEIWVDSEILCGHRAIILIGYNNYAAVHGLPARKI